MADEAAGGPPSDPGLAGFSERLRALADLHDRQLAALLQQRCGAPFEGLGAEGPKGLRTAAAASSPLDFPSCQILGGPGDQSSTVFSAITQKVEPQPKPAPAPCCRLALTAWEAGGVAAGQLMLPGSVCDTAAPDVFKPLVKCPDAADPSELRPDGGLALAEHWACQSGEGSGELGALRRDSTFLEVSEGRAGQILTSRGFISNLVVPPTSWKRLVWDVLGVLAIAYDILTIPLMVFDFDSLRAAQIISLVTNVFWACDICFSFFIGFIRDDGRCEMRQAEIMRRYLRSWFASDLFVVTLDFGLYFSTSQAASMIVGIARLGKTMRIVRVVRVLRMVRLVRVLKLMSIVEEMIDLLYTGPVATAVSLFKLMGGVAMFAHFLACLWYHVGMTAREDHQPSWVAKWLEEGAGPVHMYTLAYHWTMAQFTPAPVDIAPKCFAERVFTVVTLFVGFVLFSSMLGSASALLNQTRKEAYERMKRSDMLRKYLGDHQVSVELSTRISSFLASQKLRGSRLTRGEVALLQSLPGSLSSALNLEVYGGIASKVPLFSRLLWVHEDAMRELCSGGMRELAVVSGEEPFRAGAAAPSGYVVVAGALQYASMLGSGLRPVREGAWLSEVALWVQWKHVGKLSATAPSMLLEVSAEALVKVARSHRLARSFLKLYAKEWAARLAAVAAREPVDDLTVVFASEQELDAAVGLFGQVGRGPLGPLSP